MGKERATVSNNWFFFTAVIVDEYTISYTSIKDRSGRLKFLNSSPPFCGSLIYRATTIT